MPDWIGGLADVNVRNSRSVSYKMQYAGGYNFNVQVGNGLLGDADYTVNEVSALRASIAAASNFGVRSQTESLENGVAPQNMEAYDDAYGPGITVNLRFQNNDQELFTVAIPGPLKRLFVGDSINLVVPDIAAAVGSGERILAELIRDQENLVNNSYAPANTYTFIGGNRAARKMTPSTKPDVITLVESPDDIVQP